MEKTIAKTLWTRSLDHKFRYVSVVSDGDSSMFRELSLMNDGAGPYGAMNPVNKLECLNHAKKRIKNAFDKIKSVKVQGPKGLLSMSRRLPDKLILKLSGY